jgi:8-oxo-dGTP pyrophosphatase MutT (NUDIX family)
VAGRLLRLAGVLPAYARTAFEGLAPRGLGGPGCVRVVQAVVLSERGVLLCVRRELRGWELPGGEVEPGEGDPDALRREVREETGLEVAIERTVGDYLRTGFRAHRARVFACRVVGGALRPSREAPRLAWFDPAALPDTIFPWFRTPLEDALRGRADPIERRERQGLAAVWAGMRIDLRMRWSDDQAK